VDYKYRVVVLLKIISMKNVSDISLGMAQELVLKLKQAGFNPDVFQKIISAKGNSLAKKMFAAIAEVASYASKLFTLVNACIEVAIYEGIFNPHEFYKKRKDVINLYVWDSFTKRILANAKAISDCPGASFTSQDLKQNVYDSEIIEDLGIKAGELNETLCHIASLIQKQPKGEAGELLNNGYANLFYVNVKSSVFVVDVYWRSAYAQWDVLGWTLGEICYWSTGNRVFSRN